MRDGCTNLIEVSGLVDAPAQHPELVCRRLGMHRKSHQDGSSGKHPDETLPDLFQKVLPAAVDLATPKVDTAVLEVRAGVPVNLNDVGGQRPFPRLVC
jgi:hypothetical protein